MDIISFFVSFVAVLFASFSSGYNEDVFSYKKATQIRRRSYSTQLCIKAPLLLITSTHQCSSARKYYVTNKRVFYFVHFKAP